jgi:MoaA/NifB/PqqE/SkfB family radical SAM enzyme
MTQKYELPEILNLLIDLGVIEWRAAPTIPKVAKPIVELNKNGNPIIRRRRRRKFYGNGRVHKVPQAPQPEMES